MTIEERIKKSKRTPFIDGFEGRIYMFTDSELHDLLGQVAKEQREACVKSIKATSLKEWDSKNFTIVNKIMAAPPPLKKSQ